MLHQTGHFAKISVSLFSNNLYTKLLVKKIYNEQKKLYSQCICTIDPYRIKTGP